MYISYLSCTSFCFQTNFNTVLAREKMKKENIINDLSDKLKMLTQQQEKDKGKLISAEVCVLSNRIIPFACLVLLLSAAVITGIFIYLCHRFD